MNKKNKSSTHAQPGTRARKKPAGFLDLPGELRNQVYDYYFQQGFKCEFAGRKARLYRAQHKSFRFYNSRLRARGCCCIRDEEYVPITTVRFSRILGRYERIQGLDTRWDTSLSGLIYVCKLVHAECIGFFYKNTTFGFDSPKRILSFLKIPSPLQLAHVTSIQLHYHTYGDPTESKNILWKQKHLNCWSRTCKAAAKQLVNLQYVDIWVHVSETSVRLNPYEPYLKPVFWFRKRNNPAKTIAKALVAINVHIDTIWSQPCAFTDKNLCCASHHLHSLFEKAISRIILGASVEAAMVDFNDAWENRYARWHHHLQFARTGW